MKRALNKFLKSTSGHFTLNFFSALTAPRPSHPAKDKDMYKLSDKELRDIGLVRGDLDEIK